MHLSLSHLPRTAAKWLLLAACLAVVALPRFDLRDPGIIGRFTVSATATPYGLPIDVEGYRRLVLYYRGEAPADSMVPPFCYRPLAPYVASFIPAPALTAINVLNLLSLFGTMLIIDLVLRYLGIRGRARTIASLLLIFSFPTFYYTTIGFIDPVAMLWVTLLLFQTLRGWMWPAMACSLLAVLTRETNLAFTVLPGLRLLSTRQRGSPVWIPALLAPILSLVSVLSVRTIAPFPEKGWFWKPSLPALIENLSRPRAYLSLVFTLGIPVVLAIVAILRKRPENAYGPTNAGLLLWGCVLAVGLYAYGITAVHVDGRVVWVIYPFAIPLAVSLIPTKRAGPPESKARPA